MEVVFKDEIKKIIKDTFDDELVDILYDLPIIQYIVKKTSSANKGSKSRGSFANLYAIYVLLEDYNNKDFHSNNNYSSYEGSIYGALLERQRQLPFGTKLQNHALNHRLNEEFKKYFPTIQQYPILRDTVSNRYWFNESLIVKKISGNDYNLSKCIIKIIDKYIEVKQNSMNNFLEKCNEMKEISDDMAQVYTFIKSLLDYNVDARLFEIVSFSILKYYYNDIVVFFGFERDELFEETLQLYKTGRTNANDGGIDFVMKPLGRFFQVTETIDFKKYFLDIDKIEKFPITFVVKTDIPLINLKASIEKKAYEIYSIKRIVDKYLESIEELINIEVLETRFDECVEKGYLSNILEEIIIQSKLEFNFEEQFD